MKATQLKTGDRIRIVGAPGDGVPGYVILPETVRVYKTLLARNRSVRIYGFWGVFLAGVVLGHFVLPYHQKREFYICFFAAYLAVLAVCARWILGYRNPAKWFERKKLQSSDVLAVAAHSPDGENRRCDVDLTLVDAANLDSMPPVCVECGKPAPWHVGVLLWSEKEEREIGTLKGKLPWWSIFRGGSVKIEAPLCHWHCWVMRRWSFGAHCRDEQIVTLSAVSTRFARAVSMSRPGTEPRGR